MSDPYFFRDLEPFHSFVEEAFDPDYYVDFPPDWTIVVADITGSTKAVEAGKYAEVNYLGAACIVAVTNAVSEHVVPSAFGGDGATLVVPEEALDATLDALLATQRWGMTAFGLELRVGAVPISEIARRGETIQVAKMEFSPGNAMAMFRGAGFDLADKLVKDGDGETRFDVGPRPAAPSMPDLDSLSCRWAPMPSENGHMLCLIIGARPDRNQDADSIYREVLDRINSIVELNQVQASPVKLTNLSFRVRLEGILKEVKSLPGPRWLNWLKVIPIHLFARVVFALNRKVGGFDPSLYQQELTINSDFRKVSGMLRLIIDCTQVQCDEVEAMLADLHDQGQIVFGVHRASAAIMTCVAPNIENHEHVHYIDGAEGGLWSAAKGLKAQLRQL
ncbi:MAG: DUF3095 family protein [Pseudomonadota bacterium]